MLKITGIALAFWLSFSLANVYAEDVTIGLNYPETGPYSIQGLAQKRAAEMAIEEINAKGGILGKTIKMTTRDTASKKDQSTQNVNDMIENDNAQMIFGGSSSAVAIAGGLAAKAHDKIYFGTLTYSNETTDEEGHSHMFRECYNAWMGAKVLSKYLTTHYSGKKYFYITADYTWGRTTEASIRKFSNTENTKEHKHILTPFPGATDADFRKALALAKANKPDVLVLVLFGSDMSRALTLATTMGLKRTMAMVVPNLTLGMAEGAGPKVMEDVVGALPWSWRIPEITNSDTGKHFVDAFATRYNSYPSSSAASAYSILYQYKDAVERAGSFETAKVIQALEGYRYQFLKDEQEWRAFDHQNIQSVYAVKGKPQADVLKDKFKQDYFDIIATLPGNEAAKTKEEWLESRRKANKPDTLE